MQILEMLNNKYQLLTEKMEISSHTEISFINN